MFNRPTRALRLRQPVGNGMANDPEDVMAVQRRLGAQGLYSWDDDGPSGFIDSDLLAGIRKFQQGRGLAVDGWLAPGGETERNLNRPPDRTPDFNPYLEHSEPVDIAGEVGNGRANDEADVTGVKRALSALGLYQYDPTSDPSPFIDRAMLDGIKAFQQQNGLKVDGWLGRGGETQDAMNAALTSEAPEQAPPARPSRNLLAVDDPKTLQNFMPAKNAVDEALESEKPVQVAQSITDLPLLGLLGAGGAAVASQAGKQTSPSPKPAGTELPPPLSIRDKIDFRNGLTNYLNEQTGADGEEDDNQAGRRGKKATRDTNDIIVQECAKLLDGEFSHLKDKVAHIGGGTIDGKGETPVPEKYIPNRNAPPDRKTLGAGFGDATHGFGDVQSPINSVDVRKTDGLPVAHEQRALEKLGRLLGEEAIPWVRKLLDGYGPEDVDEVRRQSKAACRESFKRLERKLNEQAEPPTAEEDKQ